MSDDTTSPSTDRPVTITVEAMPGDGGYHLSVAIQELLRQFMPGAQVSFVDISDEPEVPLVHQMIVERVRADIQSRRLAVTDLFEPGNLQVIVQRQLRPTPDTVSPDTVILRAL